MNGVCDFPMDEGWAKTDIDVIHFGDDEQEEEEMVGVTLRLVSAATQLQTIYFLSTILKE